MKICLIGGIYSPGGGRKNFLKITPETTLESGLRDAGHQVTTLSHYDHADFSRFDVVHVHHLSYGAIRMASDLSRTPFVFTAHDSSRMNGHPQGGLQRAAVPFVLSRADAIVALSHREAAFLDRHYTLRGTRMAVIPNGIDPSNYSFHRSNAAGQDAPWRILFAGQLIPLKGVDILLRAIALRPENIRLTLVYQTAQLETELRALATELGIADRVEFAGRLDPRALADRYHSHDLLVLPSATEALPSVITEAMMCGLPFIATAAGGIPEQAAGFGQLLQPPDAGRPRRRHRRRALPLRALRRPGPGHGRQRPPALLHRKHDLPSRRSLQRSGAFAHRAAPAIGSLRADEHGGPAGGPPPRRPTRNRTRWTRQLTWLLPSSISALRNCPCCTLSAAPPNGGSARLPPARPPAVIVWSSTRPKITPAARNIRVLRSAPVRCYTSGALRCGELMAKSPARRPQPAARRDPLPQPR